MRNFLIPIIILLALPAVASPADAARGLLHADGLLNVKGVSADESLITVIPADAPSYALEKGTTKFMLSLELNSTYLVTFERPGCLTKELYFDTRVPEEYRIDEYTFPFEVELEADAQASTKSYVGPVGFIAYMAMVNDFDYETDYTLQISPKIQEHIDAMMASRPIAAASATDPTLRGVSSTGMSTVETSETPVPVKRMTATPSNANVTRVGNRTPVNAPAPVAKSEPVIKETPPDELATIEAEIVSPPETPEPIATTVIEVPVVTEEVIEPVVEDEPVASAIPAAAPSMHRSYPAPDPSMAGRQEELIVDDKRVTTIVRIVNDQGYSTEYRRVAHKFGAVFYFKDEESITEDMYRDETGMPANEGMD